jgi:hypothetical protein
VEVVDVILLEEVAEQEVIELLDVLHQVQQEVLQFL